MVRPLQFMKNGVTIENRNTYNVCFGLFMGFTVFVGVYTYRLF